MVRVAVGAVVVVEGAGTGTSSQRAERPLVQRVVEPFVADVAGQPCTFGPSSHGAGCRVPCGNPKAVRRAVLAPNRLERRFRQVHHGEVDRLQDLAIRHQTRQHRRREELCGRDLSGVVRTILLGWIGVQRVQCELRVE